MKYAKKCIAVNTRAWDEPMYTPVQKLFDAYKYIDLEYDEVERVATLRPTYWHDAKEVKLHGTWECNISEYDVIMHSVFGVFHFMIASV